MRRALVGAGLLLAVVAALAVAVDGGAQPKVFAADLPEAGPPSGCTAKRPEQAKDPWPSCRAYLFQIHCDEAWNAEAYSVTNEWRDWCNDLKWLQNRVVPRCSIQFAKESGELAERCRIHLANKYCFWNTGNYEQIRAFCESVPGTPKFPRPCTPELAREKSQEGNACWDKLAGECKSREIIPGDKIEDFCTAVAAGEKKRLFNCDQKLADQMTDVGRQCREQFYAENCLKVDGPPPELKAWCGEVTEERTNAPPPEPPPDTQPKPDGSRATDGSPDVILQLGREPACDDRSKLSSELARACAITGSAMHQFPFAHYGIDNNVTVDVGESDFWSGEAPLLSMFQWIMVGVWQALIWLVKIGLLVVQWAFAKDPLTKGMPEIEKDVMAFSDLLGPEWRTAALAVAGVWGIWNGLIRLKTTETLAGLAATVLLMIGAMWIVYDPDDTVGKVARLSNDAALTMLSATSSGELQSPDNGLARSQRGVFDQMVVGPWCALEFGGRARCEKETGQKDVRVRDLWMSLPANSPGRRVLYKATKDGPEEARDAADDVDFLDVADAVTDGLCMYSGIGLLLCDDDDVTRSEDQENADENPGQQEQTDKAIEATNLIQKDPASVELQGKNGVFTRLGLFIVIAVGIAGAVAFLFSIGVRLVTASVFSMFLILLAPVMLLVAAFGAGGRRRFGEWLRMLLGAVVAKLVYAVILGLALLIVGILNSIDLREGAGLILPATANAAPSPKEATAGQESDWLGNWLLVTAFWWTAVWQLNRILALLAPDPAGEGSRGIGASAGLYFGQRMLGSMLRTGWRSASVMPRMAMPRVLGALRRGAGNERARVDQGIRRGALDEMGRRANDVARGEFAEKGRKAHEVLDSDRPAASRRRMQDLDARIQQESDPAARADLETQRADASRALREDEAGEHLAKSELVRQADGFKDLDDAGTGAKWAERERDVQEQKDGRSVWFSKSNRRWAGITDEEYSSAWKAGVGGDPAAMEALRARSEAALKRDSALLARADKDPLSRGVRRGVRVERATRGPSRPMSVDGDAAKRARKERDRREGKRGGPPNRRDRLWRWRG